MLPGRPTAALRAAAGSLKLRITLGATAALALGIGLSTAVLVRQAERDTLAMHAERELADASRTASMLSRRVVERQRALQITASQLERATLADPALLTAFVEARPILVGQFTSLFVVDGNGQMRVTADASGIRAPAQSVADRDYFRRTLAERRSVISEPLPGRLAGQSIVVLTWPLLNDGQVVGVLGGVLPLASRELLDNLADGAATDSRALTVVSDSRGRLLARPDQRETSGSLADDPRLAQAFAHWVAIGSPQEPAGLHLPQAGEVVTAAGVAGTDWMLWRAVPEAEVLAPLRAARRDAIAWALGAIGAVSLVTLGLLWRMLRPLTQLEHRAQHLFDGTLEAHAGWPGARGELGRLERVLRHVGAERAQLESFNTALLQKLGSVMRTAPVGIAFTRDRRFELVSAEFCRLLGHTEASLLGHPARIIYASDEAYAEVGLAVGQAFGAGRPYEGELRLLCADGSCLRGCLRGRPVEIGNADAGTIWTLNDIGDQLAVREQLEWSAMHDTLTGLANRKLLALRLATVFDAMPMSVPAAVLMIDLDHFKPINDSAGHAAGDAMLQAVAAAITARVRGSDLAVRLGGDEFALLLERCPPDVAMRVAADVLDAVHAIALPWEGRLLRVGASIGLAALGAETRDAKAWLADADAACYAAKAQGRGRVCQALRPLLRDAAEASATAATVTTP